ncbi:MAG: DUF4373 domain-containing protein [Bacteroides oleiciplenus]|nr:DUF4373 domain-containing protein [Bacteroides oleiciplenus]
MAMIYNSIPYFPTQVNLFEEVSMELIEAKYGMKAETAVMKLICKIYKENGYYLHWNDEQCVLFSNKAGKEIAADEMQGIVDILIEKGFFDKGSYEEHCILTSVNIQKVWLDATKRRRRDLTSLPYMLVKPEEDKKGVQDGKSDKDNKDSREADGMQNPENSVQDADSLPEIADNSGQSKTEQNKADENKGFPPLTPPSGKDVDVWRRYSFIEFPGYAYNKSTHNLECLLLSLDELHINDPDDIKAILKLSDYGRLGNGVWKIIHNTRWSIVLNNGKYIIGALNKTRKQG